jgi:hypothetical protein
MIVSGSAKARLSGRLALVWGLLSMLSPGGYEANAGGMSAPGFTSGIPVYAKLPEGFYYLNQHSSGFRDIEGGDVRTNTNIFFLYYQSPWEVAGGSLSFVLAPTLFEVSTSPGERYAGFYNTYVGAQLSWPTGWEGLRVGYRISGYIPQGGEVAFDYGSIENRFGLTYGRNDWSVLANFIIGTPVGDGGADVAPNYFLADFHVLRTSGKWTFGPVAHVSADLSEPHAEYNRQSQLALGGLLGYDFGPLTLQAKLTRDVEERNYGSKETIVWTNIVIPLRVP